MTDGKVRREKNIIKQVVLGEVASALNINRKLDRWMGGWIDRQLIDGAIDRVLCP